MGVIDPDVTAASTVETGWVSMASFELVMATVLVGTLGTNATVDAKLEQATSAAGAGAKDITGKAITQLTQAGTDESDKQAIIECRADELDVENNFTHVRLSITVGTATSDVGGLIHGLNPRYAPPTDADSVAEIVA
jgi:hypothetical protein